jgi:RND family efflux transporter MFP subunit
MQQIMMRALSIMLLCTASAAVCARDVIATIDWGERHHASVSVEGFVDNVQVNIGQRVRKGDKLLQLNTSLLEAVHAQAKAGVAAQQPAYEDAKREYADAESLFEQTVLSAVELQRAKMGFDIAAAKLEAARGRLRAAQARLERTAVYALWDAIVIARDVEVGQMIAGDERSRPLLKLARASSRLARAGAATTVLAELAVGDAVQVRADGKMYAAQVQSLRQVQNAAAETSLEITVEFEVVADSRLMPGQAATIVWP